MPARHRSLAAPHAGVTQAVLLLGSSLASLSNYPVSKRPFQSLLEKNVLQKLNLNTSQEHIPGFMTQRRTEKHWAKDLFSTSLQSSHCPERSMCREGCEQWKEGAAWGPGPELEIPAVALAAGALRWDLPAWSKQALQSHQCLSFLSGRDPAPTLTFQEDKQNPLGMDPDTSQV